MKEHRSKINTKLWEYSNAVNYFDYEIENRKIFIEQAYNPLRAATSDGMPRGGNISDTTFETTVLVERYQKEILAYIQQKEQALKNFEIYIEPLKCQYKEVLRLRYIKGMNAQKIAWKLNYTPEHIKWLIGQAQDVLR